MKTSCPNRLTTTAARLFCAGLLLAACGDGGAGDRGRGPIGKADLVGSCAGNCGGPATDGNCWCDDECSEIGDCCEDVEEECGGAPPDAGVGTAVVFDNPDQAFELTEWCDCIDPEEGNALDLTRPADMQSGEAGPTSIDFLKVDPSVGNITSGGFWLRGWRDPDDTGEVVSFAASDELVLPGDPDAEVETRVIPPQAKFDGDTVGPADSWQSGKPELQRLSPAGVQTVHFQDLAGESAPDQTFFTNGIVGVRFTLDDGTHYGFVELELVQPDTLFRARYVPVRWGYNPVPDEALEIPQ